MRRAGVALLLLASLAACAPKPTSAMNSGIIGAVNKNNNPTTQSNGITAAAKTMGSNAA